MHVCLWRPIILNNFSSPCLFSSLKLLQLLLLIQNVCYLCSEMLFVETEYSEPCSLSRAISDIVKPFFKMRLVFLSLKQMVLRQTLLSPDEINLPSTMSLVNRISLKSKGYVAINISSCLSVEMTRIYPKWKY